MSLIRIQGTVMETAPRVPLLSLGFRPFFLGAGLFAILAMGAWTSVYVGGHAFSPAPISASQWHAHEMIYGYAMAVIAGFMLTAVENWTGRKTLRGVPLAALFATWLSARLLYLAGARFFLPAGALDLLFTVLLGVAVVVPIVRTRQWRQMAVAAKVCLFSMGQLLFLLGVMGTAESGIYWSLYGGFYLVIGLIMTMGARIMPPFIQNGVDEDVVIASPRWIALSSLVFFLGFFIAEVVRPGTWLTPVFAGALFIVTTVRLALWHTPGLWKRPLLWSLYLAFAFIDAGFLLFALRPWLGWPVYFPVHAMAVGGIGLVTLGMMARVSLGHSGRSVLRPPDSVGWTAGLLIAAAVVRVPVAALLPERYVMWIFLAQILWILAFALFLFSFARIFLQADARAPDR